MADAHFTYRDVVMVIRLSVVNFQPGLPFGFALVHFAGNMPITPQKRMTRSIFVWAGTQMLVYGQRKA